MLSQMDNELITRVGPGTPMGSLMRQYWLPALLSSELPKADCDPVRVLLLGEKLIAFRDTLGRPGLLANHCPHRGASLFFARNEECGLRCVYHGWKFDITGRCLDMPNQPPESDFKDRVRAKAYPCVERGGLVWAYLGPRETPPHLPALESFDAPEDKQFALAIQRECNWLQALEGDIDTSHFSFLHTGHLEPGDAKDGTYLRYNLEHRAPRYKVLDTEFGASYGAYRPAGDPGHVYWRIAHFLFPFYTMIPTGTLGKRISARAWVPMDDEHSMLFHIEITRHDVEQMRLMPNTSDWYGRFRATHNARNDYLIDRDKQRRGESYMGLSGNAIGEDEDHGITESMGPIYDRTQEHLGTSDVMVIRVRRRLIAAVKALADKGTVPPGVDDPAIYRQRSGRVILPKDTDWVQATADARQIPVEEAELALPPAW